MDEFLAVCVSLSAQNVQEDQDNDVVGQATWVLDNAVSNQENGSDILEAVAGQKEANSGSLNGISEDWLDFLVNSAWVIDWLNVVDHGQEFGFSFQVIGVLDLNKIVRFWALRFCFQVWV